MTSTSQQNIDSEFAKVLEELKDGTTRKVPKTFSVTIRYLNELEKWCSSQSPRIPPSQVMDLLLKKFISKLANDSCGMRGTK